MNLGTRLILSAVTLLLISACSLPSYHGINLAIEMEGDEKSAVVNSDSLSDPKFILSCSNGLNAEVKGSSFEVPAILLTGCLVKLLEFKNDGVVFSYLDGFQSHRPPEEGRFQDASGNILFVRILKQLPIRVVENSQISFSVSAISYGDEIQVTLPKAKGRISIHAGEVPEFEVTEVRTLGFRGLGITMTCKSLQLGTSIDSLDCGGASGSSLQVGFGVYQGESVDAAYLEQLLLQSPIEELPSETVEYMAPTGLSNGGFRYYPDINYILSEGLKFILVLKRHDDNGSGYLYYILKMSSTDENTHQRIFVTSKLYNGDLGGVNGAHDKCQEAANNANLGGNWMAVISDTNSAAKDTVPSLGPLYNMKGEQVTGMGKLFDTEAVFHHWAYDEFGTELQPNELIFSWTGTAADGSSTQSNCHNWTSSRSLWDIEIGYAIEELGTNGYVGDSEFVEMNSHVAFEWGTNNCESSQRLYCISID